MNFKQSLCILGVGLFLAGLGAGAISADEFKTQNPDRKSGVSRGCQIDHTTICTIEVWLEHKHKKDKQALRKMLKDKHIKVLHHTFQFW